MATIATTPTATPALAPVDRPPPLLFLEFERVAPAELLAVEVDVTVVFGGVLFDEVDEAVEGVDGTAETLCDAKWKVEEERVSVVTTPAAASFTVTTGMTSSVVLP